MNDRRILKVKRIRGRTYFITLKKIARRGYDCDYTVYVSGDSKVFKLTRKHAKKSTKSK